MIAFHVPPLLEPEPLLGHLLITVRRHADTWADLTPSEAADVGMAAAALAGPLRETTGAERIYSRITLVQNLVPSRAVSHTVAQPWQTTRPDGSAVTIALTASARWS